LDVAALPGSGVPKLADSPCGRCDEEIRPLLLQDAGFS
jgi:hypothetical protein